MAGVRVIITAGGAGIGGAMADAFSARGASVYVSDIDSNAIAASPHLGSVADMGRAEDVHRFMDSAFAKLGGLDVLINNAGIAGPVAPVQNILPEELDAVLNVNLASQFHCARHAVPALRQSGRGCMINISSVAGKYGFSLRTPYSATKWGIIGLTRSLAIELGPDNIRVNAILPGTVEGHRARFVLAAKAADAGMSPEDYTARALSRISLRCMVSPQDIANMALYLASPFGARITGQAISVDGGMESMS
ncbi:SDR family oxidoreductase [Bradyrhizobium sp. AUGA SZCCT0240]|nr:SDR family oxidoreductase [Bradyrhizobium sp. AUGA SZCCT0240]